MKKINLIFTFTYIFAPLLVVAQNEPLGTHTFGSLIMEFILVLNLLVPILIGLAMIFFFWGLSKFILNADNQANIQKGKDYMLWGVLALFVLFSFDAIINLIASELGLGTPGGVIPTLNTTAN